MVRLDLDSILAEAEKRQEAKKRQSSRPTLGMLCDPSIWPPPIASRYFVQAEGDVRALRDLQGALAGRNIGVAANVDAVLGTPWSARRPVLGRLLDFYLESGQPVYVDTGVYPRFRSNRPLPDFGRVFGFYESLIRVARKPESLAVTAPDVIGNRRATRDLQRRWRREILGMLQQGVRVVVPVQGRTASELLESMVEIMDRFPNAWVGVPVRSNDTTPLLALVEALLSLGRMSVAKPPMLPRLHLLGLGGSPRAEQYGARIAAIYRILRGPKIYQILLGREKESGMLARIMAQVQGLDSSVASWLVSAPISDLLRLVGCVATRSMFPCPPFARFQTMEGHPAIDEDLRFLWHHLGGRPDSPKLAPFVSPGLNFWTKRVLGRADLTVDWHSLVERYGDWDGLCISAMQTAEQTDPCMVTGAWDADDLDHLVSGSGLGRIEMDAQSVSFAAKTGRWLVGGVQKRAPKWWQNETRAYRFTWNLLMLAWDRWEREQRLGYEYASGYDEDGFTTTSRARLAPSKNPWLLKALSGGGKVV